MTEYSSLSKYLSKDVQVVLQVVNNKKVMAKTPREANLYGNWCVCKGLNCDTVFADWTDEGKVFQRIIDRGIKVDRIDILYSQLELDMALYRTDIQRWTMVKALEKTNTKGSRYSTFCKKVPKCESQTSSGEVVNWSDYTGKTIREGESAWPLVLRCTQGKHTP